jgi:hypothetical protein
MMYKKNLVAAIRVNGKVLRESNDRVQLPFGSEYSILLKNLDTVRQQVNIQIDGKESSGWIVLNPGEKQNLERFPRNNLSEGNRFKFIERTEAVENHRGIAAEDGLVRIEFKREIVDPPPVQTWTINSNDASINNALGSQRIPGTGIRSGTGAASVVTDMWKYGNSNSYPCSSFDPSATVTRSGACGQSVNSSPRATYAQGNQSYSGTATMDWNGPLLNAQAVYFDKQVIPNLNDTGITVDGSLSDQQFTSVQGFDTEDPQVLILHLVGRQGDAPIQVARTVRIKVVCPTCGLKNRSLVKFCSQCGTNLEKV